MLLLRHCDHQTRNEWANVSLSILRHFHPKKFQSTLYKLIAELDQNWISLIECILCHDIDYKLIL